jgi:hypothetical protein
MLWHPCGKASFVPILRRRFATLQDTTIAPTDQNRSQRARQRQLNRALVISSRQADCNIGGR